MSQFITVERAHEALRSLSDCLAENAIGGLHSWEPEDGIIVYVEDPDDTIYNVEVTQTKYWGQICVDGPKWIPIEGERMENGEWPSLNQSTRGQ